MESTAHLQFTGSVSQILLPEILYDRKIPVIKKRSPNPRDRPCISLTCISILAKDLRIVNRKTPYLVRVFVFHTRYGVIIYQLYTAENPVLKHFNFWTAAFCQPKNTRGFFQTRG